jgi:ABC-type hemin transport system substrate-binding protein
VVGNTIVTAAAHAYATSIIVNLAKAARNMITGSDETSQHPKDVNSAT